MSSRLDELKRGPLKMVRSRKGWEGEDMSKVRVIVGRRVLKVVKNKDADVGSLNIAKMSSI